MTNDKGPMTKDSSADCDFWLRSAFSSRRCISPMRRKPACVSQKRLCETLFGTGPNLLR
jgi:hypothetical protein